MKYFLSICLFLFLISCKEKYTPKPYGYYRIDFPEEKSYQWTREKLPYTFEIAGNATIEPDQTPDAEKYWINIVYPEYNARINISYKEITTDSSLAGFMQDCHRMAYVHTVKADAINERLFEKEKGTFGLLYYIEGNTASSTQFFMTDSVKNFLRGSLYFKAHPNKDSLAPVIDYLRKDIIVLMESLQFKKPD